MSRHHRDIGFGLCERNVFLQPSGDSHRIPILGRGNPELGLHLARVGFQSAETLWRNTDDFVAIFSQRKKLPDHLPAGREPSHPKGVADHHFPGRSGRARVGIHEKTAESRCQLERGKVIS